MSMAGSHMLTSEDWALVTLMDTLNSPCAVAHELDSFSPLRSEAILHAWPNDPCDELAEAAWAHDYLTRWPAVEAMMDGLAPATWSHETMEDLARAAEDAA